MLKMFIIFWHYYFYFYLFLLLQMSKAIWETEYSPEYVWFPSPMHSS